MQYNEMIKSQVMQLMNSPVNITSSSKCQVTLTNVKCRSRRHFVVNLCEKLELVY